jgi:hypothetical protein
MVHDYQEQKSGSYLKYVFEICRLYAATLHYNPEDRIVHSHRCENLKSNTIIEFSSYVNKGMRHRKILHVKVVNLKDRA